MKELLQKDFPLRIIEDLGMQQSTPTSKYTKRFAMFECPICLKAYRVAAPQVKIGTSSKCGSCSSRLSSITHGCTNTPGYKRWEGMISRCYNIANESYHRYGARGITVCDEWRTTPVEYLKYISNLPNAFIHKWSLDRIDNNKGYTPDNIRWAAPITQAENGTNGTHGKSKYKGVTWNKSANKWMVRLMVNGVRTLIGYYSDELEAANAYDAYIISIGMPNKITNKELYE
jgi:hypothetical protein